MKNVLITVFVLAFLFLLYSYVNQNGNIDIINNAKNELLSGDETKEKPVEEVKDNKDEAKIEKPETNEEKFEENMSKFEEIEKNIVENKKKIEIKYLDDNKFIEIDDLESKDLLSREVEITGKTLASVDKIVVNFSNIESSFPEDTYQLKTYKSGASTFLYRAFAKYETIDFGKNKYIIEAYSGDKVSKLELIINVENEVTVEEKTTLNKLESNSILETLPVSGVFGNPRDLGSSKVAYSDIKGLEITLDKESNLELDGDSATSFLSENVEGWFFWNTLRPIKNDKGISFFVIRVSGDKYFYEKHYYIPESKIYGVLELETGTGISTDELSDKNKEFKEKNDDYSVISISDMLFKEMIK